MQNTISAGDLAVTDEDRLSAPELRGWKRLEMSKVIKFEGITEQSFESIFRRGWVVVLVARFLSEQQYATVPGNPERFGIFKKQPDLKDFLRSGPSVCATLNILRGHMARKTKECAIGPWRST